MTDKPNLPTTLISTVFIGILGLVVWNGAQDEPSPLQEDHSCTWAEVQGWEHENAEECP